MFSAACVGRTARQPRMRPDSYIFHDGPVDRPCGKVRARDSVMIRLLGVKSVGPESYEARDGDGAGYGRAFDCARTGTVAGLIHWSLVDGLPCRPTFVLRIRAGRQTSSKPAWGRTR